MTGAWVLNTPDGDSAAHFVPFQQADARRQAAQFVATSSLEGAGIVVAP